MKERRKYEGKTLVFDYKALIETDKRGKKLLKMKKGPITYTTEEGTRFFNEHPFQWVKKGEADHLLSLPEEGYIHFVEATIEQVEDYYVY